MGGSGFVLSGFLINSILIGSYGRKGWFSTYWFLSIEEHFYLLWPWVLMVTPRNLGWTASIGVAGVIGLRIGIAMTDWPESIIYNNTFTRIDGLLLGSFLAWMNQLHRIFLMQLGCVAGCLFLIGGLAFVVPMYLGLVGGGAVQSMAKWYFTPLPDSAGRQTYGI